MATLVCSSFVFMSCDDDDDKFTPESIVTKAFDTKYPDAQRVSWENEAGYVKAEFYTGSYEAEAWFDPQRQLEGRRDRDRSSLQRFAPNRKKQFRGKPIR